MFTERYKCTECGEYDDYLIGPRSTCPNCGHYRRHPYDTREIGRWIRKIELDTDRKWFEFWKPTTKYVECWVPNERSDDGK